MFKNLEDKYDWRRLTRHVQNQLKEDKTGHDFSHIQRVMNNCYIIAQDMDDINYNVLTAACLLHDVSYSQGPSKEHHILSADMATRLLPDFGFNNGDIEQIVHAIKNHNRSFGSKGLDKVENLSLEAKVLYDADVIDALGAVGLIRMVSFSLYQNVPYYIPNDDEVDKSFYGNIKFLNKMAESILTKPGKKMAKQRLEIVINFAKELKKECQVSSSQVQFFSNQGK